MIRLFRWITLMTFIIPMTWNPFTANSSVGSEEISVSQKILEQYVGIYEVPPDLKITITREGSQLSVYTTGMKIPVFASSETKFFSKMVVDAQIEFFKNEHGEVTHFILYMNGREVKAQRTDEKIVEMKGQRTSEKTVNIIEEKAPFPGYLCRPDDDAPHPGIIFLHGSEGGNGDYWYYPGKPPVSVGKNAGFPILARYYASLGYVTYAVCYFDCKHHEGYDKYPPDELKNIDLLKITHAAFLWLKKSEYVQNKKVAIWGNSRGAEQILLLASLIGKYQNSVEGLILPDAILAISPPDYVAGAFTEEQAKAMIKGENLPGRYNDPAWIFADNEIKMFTLIDIQYYKDPVLVTYFSQDTIWWSNIHPENLAEKYSINNIPYAIIPYSNKIDVNEALKTARENMDKNLFINFTEEKGHCFPHDEKSSFLMTEVIKTFLKTHLGN